MFEQFGPLYWQLPINIENPSNTTYQRLYRSLTDGFFYLRNHNGTDELFSTALGLQSGMNFVGGYDAFTNLYPTIGSGPAGAIAQGDTFVITVAGVLGGIQMQVGDLIIARVDNAGQVAGNWVQLEMAGAFVPYTGANATVDLNTQTLIAGLFRLGNPAGISRIELQNNTTGSQLEIADAGAGFNSFTLQLGTTGSLTEFHFTAPAFLVDKNQRFDTVGAAQIYTNNGAAGIGINGANDVSGAVGIFIQGNGVLELADETKGSGVLAAGVAVIASTKITATSKIMITVTDSLAVGVPVGVPYIETKTVGAGFTVNSKDLTGNIIATDTRTFDWVLFE